MIVSRIKKDGTLLLNKVINERLPVVTDGLIAHYPLDGKAGSIDVIGGNGSNQNLEQNMNILDAMKDGGWRNPLNWGITTSWDDSKQALRIEGPQNGALNIPVIIDVTKHYEIQMSVYIESHIDGGDAHLYLGGYGYDINGVWVTTNWMYFLAAAHEYVSLTGVWTTFKATLSGSGEITMQNNYNFATYPSETCGWSSNGRTTYKYYFGGLFNYSQGGVMYIKDCVVRTVDPNTSNVIIADDGIAIQDAVTNLLQNQPIATFGGWGAILGTTNNFIAPNNRKGITLQLFSNSGGGVQWKVGLDHLVVTPNTIYTLSCKIKFSDISKISANFFYVRQYTSFPGTQISEAGIFNPSNIAKLNNGYYLTWSSFKTDVNCYIVDIQGYEYTPNQKISCYDTQLEKNSFAREFVNGTTSNYGLLSFPTELLNKNEGTISFLCRMNKTNQEFSCIMSINWWSSPITRDTINFYRGNGWGDAINWMLFDGSQGTGTGSGFTGIDVLTNHVLSFIIGWSVSTSTVKVRIYDLTTNTLLHQNYSTYSFNGFSSIGPLYLGSLEGGAAENGVYSKLSIYNRLLSDTEYIALSGEGLKQTTTKVITPKIFESPIIPSDAYYYPLSSDTMDIDKTVKANTYSNIAFEDNSVWVGKSTTNLFASPDNLNNASWNQFGTTWNNSKLIKLSGQSAIYQPQGALPNNNVYSISWRMSGVVDNQTIRLSLENAIDGSYILTTLSKNLKTYYRSGTANGTGNFDPLLYQFTGDNPNDVSYIRLLNAQLEQKTFPSPFVNGTRGNSDLTYNFNSSIGLDWSGDWTICYWKKPIATHSDNFTGYNIESMGCNGNTIGNTYIWWGKTDGSDNIFGTDVSSVNPLDYFNKWQFITIIKSGSSCVIKTKLDNNVVYTRSVSTTTTANGFVTQFGYDFKLGGWDNTNPTNTYFRDLIVGKRAFSDTEILNIYKQFTIYKTGINTKKIIEEGI